MKSCTGAQLTTIQSLRKELGIRLLSNYEVKCMSINSASIMIDDLQKFKNTIESIKGGVA